MDEPYIEIDSPDNHQGAQAVAFTYNMDIGPLAMPAHIYIGAKSHDGSEIKSYANQVEDYDVWLEDAVKARQPDICEALELIYQKAFASGVILLTAQKHAPNITHAHVVRRTIMNLI